jgi:hypothetical protein
MSTPAPLPTETNQYERHDQKYRTESDPPLPKRLNGATRVGEEHLARLVVQKQIDALNNNDVEHRKEIPDCQGRSQAQPKGRAYADEERGDDGGIVTGMPVSSPDQHDNRPRHEQTEQCVGGQVMGDDHHSCDQDGRYDLSLGSVTAPEYQVGSRQRQRERQGFVGELRRPIEKVNIAGVDETSHSGCSG